MRAQLWIIGMPVLILALVVFIPEDLWERGIYVTHAKILEHSLLKMLKPALNPVTLKVVTRAFFVFMGLMDSVTLVQPMIRLLWIAIQPVLQHAILELGDTIRPDDLEDLMDYAIIVVQIAVLLLKAKQIA